MTAKLECPECSVGTVDVYEAETPVTVVRQAPRTMPVVETVLRPCLIAACNACEFCVEIDAKGSVQ